MATFWVRQVNGGITRVLQKLIYSLGTCWGPVDFYEPDLQLLIHHKVEAKELEALVVKMLRADCRLYTHKAASVKGKAESQG